METGLRLSTRKPTIIVTDRVQKPPFVIGVIGYIEYQRDLEYNAIEEFIERLSKKLSEVFLAAAENRYKSFVENFRFETVTPSNVNLTSDEYIIEKINSLVAGMTRLERTQQAYVARESRPTLSRRTVLKQPPNSEILRTKVSFGRDLARELETTIDRIPGMFCILTNQTDNEAELVVFADDDRIVGHEDLRNKVRDIIRILEDT